MHFDERDVLFRKEQMKDRIRQAALHNAVVKEQHKPNMWHRLIGRLGVLLVGLGTKLQGYATITPPTTTSLQNQR